MKIVSSRKGIHSPEFYKKKLRERRIKIVLWALLIVIVVCTPLYLLRMERFLISGIEIQGGEVTKSEDLERIVSQEILGKYLWLIPRSNVLVYPKNKIKKDILNQIPRLVSVDASLNDSRTLVITIVERKPFALYCIDDSNCFFLDEYGYIFSEAPDFSDGVYTIYSKEPVLENPLGETLMSVDKLSQITEFLNNLNTLGIYSKNFLIKNDEYQITLPHGGVITLGASSDLMDIYSTLETFVSDPSFSKEENAFERILYIDLRLSNKIFYKFK